MATPQKQQPERKPSPAARSLPPASAAAQDTNRPTDSTPMATGTFASLPMRFGRYQVEKLLGRGAMGAVYLARDTRLERLVALKIPKLSGSGAAKLLQRLKTEARAAAQIDHPSVCPVYDSGDIDGTSYIAMQYIEGETLKDHLQKQTHTPSEVVKLILLLAEGLAEAHSRGIYHRDLKPENIKLNRRGTPVIMDFGLAKLAATVSADAGKTQSGTILGSPAYMSPEQASGKVDEIDHRSDLYSLGVMLFEMLTGQWPFTGGAMQVMGQKSILDPPSPLTIKPDLDPQLAAVCQKLIAKKREDRYRTAKEVIAALEVLDLGDTTGGSSSSIPAGQSPSAIAHSLLAFDQDDAFSSMIARKRQEANRKVTTADVASKIRRIAQSGAGWWRGQPHAMKWTGLAAGVLVVGSIGLLVSGVFVNLKTSDRELFNATLKSVKAVPQKRSPREAKRATVGREVHQGGDGDAIDFKTSPTIDRLRGHSAKVQLLAFSPDGSRLVSASNSNHDEVKNNVCYNVPGSDNTVRIWKLDPPRQIRQFNVNDGSRYGPQGLAVSPDGRFVAVSASWLWGRAYTDPTVQVFDMNSGVKKQTFKLSDNSNRAMRAVAFSADGAAIYAARSGVSLHELSLQGGIEVSMVARNAASPGEMPFANLFMPDGDRIVSGHWGGPICMWNRRTGEQIQQFKGHEKNVTAIAVSPDGTRLVSAAEDYSLRLWDTNSGKELLALVGLDILITSVAISPNQKWFATGENDGAVRIRDAATGKQLVALPGGSSPMLSLAIAPNGKIIASGSENGTILLWTIK